MKVFKHFSQIATLKTVHKKDGRMLVPKDLDIIEDAAIVFDEDIIHWVGKTADLPKKYFELPSSNYSRKCLIPEIVDCHTHLLFGGDRSKEYAMRLNGADYEEIASFGGGILFTQSETNSLSSKELFKLCCKRIERMHSYGVGSIEIKSGYGLNIDREIIYSNIINDLKLKYKNSIQIKNTFMAAHAIPDFYTSSKQYMNGVVLPLLEKMAPLKIIDAVDIFHEKNYFDSDDVKNLFDLANKFNIPLKSHADEFYDNKGAVLAASYNALSTDHLLKTSADGIEALKNSSTVATLLPGTAFFLGKEQVNARAFLDAGVKVAIGSDYNPGSCHFDNIILIASLAAPQYKMNIAELFASITYNGAHAMGLKSQGVIQEGMKPRFSIFKTDTIDQIPYSWGQNFSINA